MPGRTGRANRNIDALSYYLTLTNFKFSMSDLITKYFHDTANNIKVTLIHQPQMRK
jgi:hypothetical protein